MSSLDAFLGSWTFSREITDHISGAQSHVKGILTFTALADGLLYHETGMLEIKGQRPMQAERRYLWQKAPVGIAVSFEDGRSFHTITLDGLRPHASHHCEPDQYEVDYDFTDWPRWRSVWQVRGPRKDYVLRSHHTRS